MPTRFLLCRDDRLLPASFLRRVVRERLGITPDEIAGGHCVALSHPKELADRLEAYLALRGEAGGRRALDQVAVERRDLVGRVIAEQADDSHRPHLPEVGTSAGGIRQSSIGSSL